MINDTILYVAHATGITVNGVQISTRRRLTAEEYASVTLEELTLAGVTIETTSNSTPTSTATSGAKRAYATVRGAAELVEALDARYLSSQSIGSSSQFLLANFTTAPTSDFIRTNGSSATTAIIPFALGVSFPSNKGLTSSGNLTYGATRHLWDGGVSSSNAIYQFNGDMDVSSNLSITGSLQAKGVLYGVYYHQLSLYTSAGNNWMFWTKSDATAANNQLYIGKQSASTDPTTFTESISTINLQADVKVAGSLLANSAIYNGDVSITGGYLFKSTVPTNDTTYQPHARFMRGDATGRYSSLTTKGNGGNGVKSIGFADQNNGQIVDFNDDRTSTFYGEITGTSFVFTGDSLVGKKAVGYNVAYTNYLSQGSGSHLDVDINRTFSIAWRHDILGAALGSSFKLTQNYRSAANAFSARNLMGWDDGGNTTVYGTLSGNDVILSGSVTQTYTSRTTTAIPNKSYITSLNPTQYCYNRIGKSDSLNNAAEYGYGHSGDGSSSNFWFVGFYGGSPGFKVFADGSSAHYGPLTGTSATFSGVLNSGGSGGLSFSTYNIERLANVDAGILVNQNGSGGAFWRDFAVYDGKGSQVMYITGSSKTTTFYGNIITIAGTEANHAVTKSQMESYVMSSHTHSYITEQDTRSVDTLPNHNQAFSLHFKSNTTNSLSDGGSFNKVLHIQGWADSTGGNSFQLGFTDNANLWMRSAPSGGGSGTWGTWYKLWSSKHFEISDYRTAASQDAALVNKSYILNLAGCKINDVNVSLSNHNHYQIYASSAYDGRDDFDLYTLESHIGSLYARSHTPNGETWYTLYNARHRGGAGDGSLYGSQIAIGMTSNTDAISFRVQNNGPWTAWRTIYHSSSPSISVPLAFINTTDDGSGTRLQIGAGGLRSNHIRTPGGAFWAESNELNSGFTSTSDSYQLALNYRGYDGGTAYFRDTYIYNGKNSQIVRFRGSDKATFFSGTVEIAQGTASTHAIRKDQLTWSAISGGLNQNISDTDLNGLATSGFYAGVTLANNPWSNGDWWYIQSDVLPQDSNWRHQEAKRLYGIAASDVTVTWRHRIGDGSWSPWVTAYHTGNLIDPFVNKGMAPSDLNSAGHGMWRLDTTHSNKPGATNYGTLLSFDNTADTGFQLCAGYYEWSEIYWRGANASTYGGSGAWMNWRRFYTGASSSNELNIVDYFTNSAAEKRAYIGYRGASDTIDVYAFYDGRGSGNLVPIHASKGWFGGIGSGSGGEAARFYSGGSAYDHVYLGFYARSASPTTRSAWVGYGSAGSSTFYINNELRGGITLTGGPVTIDLATASTHAIRKDQADATYLPISGRISNVINGPSIDGYGNDLGQNFIYWLAASDMQSSGDVQIEKERPVGIYRFTIYKDNIYQGTATVLLGVNPNASHSLKGITVLAPADDTSNLFLNNLVMVYNNGAFGANEWAVSYGFKYKGTLTGKLRIQCESLNGTFVFSGWRSSTGMGSSIPTFEVSLSSSHLAANTITDISDQITWVSSDIVNQQFGKPAASTYKFQSHNKMRYLCIETPTVNSTNMGNYLLGNIATDHRPPITTSLSISYTTASGSAPPGAFSGYVGSGGDIYVRRNQSIGTSVIISITATWMVP